AKEQIKNAMTAYFTKDQRGNYVIPMHKQRPIFLMGPPGIGKTAIMEQVAAELGVGMLSYSMTHHTRQSALGLPYIEHKTYGDKEYAVSEYTMSEIIASIYDLMEETGVREGILFLDEINCVSETLAPIMLQFLQYKVFGRHRVPEGWVVVTAGNPPEYNNSVREFDIVTWDRLKRVDVEPDYDVWKEYAYKTGVHPSVLTYLDIRKQDFYKIESTIDGKRFVTARGWDDLSQMIALYEQHNLTIDEDLVGQYLQDQKIAKQFAVYYDLFNKYRSDYQVDEILAGNASEDILERAMKAGFDERLSLIGLLLDAVTEEIKIVINGKKELEYLMQILKQFRVQIAKSSQSPIDILYALRTEELKKLDSGKKAGSLSHDKEQQMLSVLDMLDAYQDMIANEPDGMQAFAMLKTDFDYRVAQMKQSGKEKGVLLDNVFTFCETAFVDGHELLILVTELTTNPYTAKYISEYGCEKYFAHNQELLFYERQKKLMQELNVLELDVDDLL
ncbi:MAG: AAA family ATPase, partial [Peptococcaceae bacterium]|nr:AAA family ATPase [Peptococcaceae bacterium]